MTKPTMEQMLQWVDGVRGCAGCRECAFPGDCPEREEAIRARLTDYDALKAKVERLKKENIEMRNSTAKEVVCCRCGKETLFYTIAPYSSKDDGDPICGECLDATDWKTRAEKAEAALAEAGPLIEAAMSDDGKGNAGWEGRVEEAALAYRARENAKKEGK